MTNPVSAAVIRDLLNRDGATAPHDGGVLGIRARPEWTGAAITFGGKPVAVVPCASALAVREALLSRSPGEWLVVLTDRDDDDLGTGITAHFVGRRLRSPDPWEAVKHGFEATAIDSALARAENRTELANALLNATPTGGWPAARSGTLTYDHAMRSVAAAHLGLASASVDLERVLEWTTSTNLPRSLANLTSLAGEPLAGLVVRWIACQAGDLAGVIGTLVLASRAEDVLPLGLVARAVGATPSDSGPQALFRRSASLPADRGPAALGAWADAAESVVKRWLSQGDAVPGTLVRVLNRADRLLTDLEAADYAGSSEILRSGLTQRLASLGDTLAQAGSRAAERVAAGALGEPLVQSDELKAVETAWERVAAHALASRDGEVRVARSQAAVQLVRWLALASAEPADLRAAIEQYWTVMSWVDRAAADAWNGVDDEELARGLRGVLEAVRARRASFDRRFADLLATHEQISARAPAGAVSAEDLLRTYVLPIARQHPVLFVLADGMSCAVASEVMDDISRQLDAWVECVPAGQTTRLAAIAAYPTLTRVSRASLFCGELVNGEQAIEQTGFAKLLQSAGVTGELFHKLGLDSSEPGFSSAHDVRAAIDNPNTRVIACVLNTIDDALDRSDPGGIEWGAESVKHLRPLLERAYRAGRIVVLASDHGHIVERRAGRMLTVESASSNRSHAFTGTVHPGEIRITGRRVLEHNGDAVLAVEDGLRYGPLKAGYHGGAAPAEVIIPVTLLTTGDVPAGWDLALPQAPAWWRRPVTAVAAAPPSKAVCTVPEISAPRPSDPPTLFDTEPETSAPQPAASSDPIAQLLSSPVYAGQRERARGQAMADEKVASLVRALLSTPGHRIDAESAAAALQVPVIQLAGALPRVQRLLNIEQYPVLDRDGNSVVLDVALLREQFSVFGELT